MTNDVHENATSSTNTCDVKTQPPVVVEDKNKSPRHPRWTLPETLVLIEGKKVAENRDKKGRRTNSIFGTEQLEPKWDAVSKYCRQNGVSRGPVQCRKRWSNLVCDFKKIKAWESRVKQESESFWKMRNDIRKDNKLPSHFDREIYHVLDGKAPTEYQLALVAVTADRQDHRSKDNEHPEVLEGGSDDVEDETIDAQIVSEYCVPTKLEFGQCSDFEQSTPEEGAKNAENEQIQTESSTKGIPAPIPISEIQYEQPIQQTESPNQGKANGKQPTESHSPKRCAALQEEDEEEGVIKRRRITSLDGCQKDYCSVEQRVIKDLEKNSKRLNEQLEMQTLNNRLDREQQKDHNDALVAALDKITQVLAKIADKL